MFDRVLDTCLQASVKSLHYCFLKYDCFPVARIQLQETVILREKLLPEF